MPTPAPLNTSTSSAFGGPPARPVSPCDIRELVSFAANGLNAMFDEERQLFCHRIVRREQGHVREGLSPRYTIMTLLGLKELELAGLSSSFDTQAIYASFIRDTKWIRGIGDLGLLIWLIATFDPDRVGDFFQKLDGETALDRYSDAQDARTMELAWFLTGLAHAAETSHELLSNLMDLSVETYHRIEENQCEYGLFGHMSVNRSLTGRLRGRIGSFADQVYPIYAMSRFAKAFHVEEPLGPALECSTAICGAQGEMGQWWWLYDAHSGRVSSRYPVYSVHQHGMAPMCLLAVEEATGQSFRQFIYKGLSWIYGANELGTDMRNRGECLTWRCILPKRSQRKFWEMALSVVRPASEGAEVGSLKILYEQRPYEYGWLLFALSKNLETDVVAKTT